MSLLPYYARLLTNRIDMKTKLTLILLFIFSATFAQQTKSTFGWAKSIGSQNNDAGRAIATDQLNNVYVTGSFEGTVDFDPNSGSTNLSSTSGYDIFIQKLDSLGNLIWVKQLACTGTIWAYSIKIDSKGDIIIVGTYSGSMDVDPGVGVTNLTTTQFQSSFVVKLNAAGSLIWGKSYEGTGSITAFYCAIDKSDNILLTGWFLDTVDFDPGIPVYNLLNNTQNSNIFIHKLDANGSFVWANQFGSARGDQAFGIVSNSDNSINVSGYFYDTVDFDPDPVTTFNLQTRCQSCYESFVLKLDSNGTFVWAKNTDGTQASLGRSQSLGLTNDSNDNIYFTGTFNGSVNFNPSGTSSYLNSNSGNIYVCKLNSNGNFDWAKAIGGSYVSKIISDHNGLYLTGWFQDTIDFDPDISSYNLISQGNQDIFIGKLDLNGAFIWADRIGGSNQTVSLSDVAFDLSLDNQSNLYLVGDFSDTVSFSVDSSTQLISNGQRDVLIHKIKQVNFVTSISEFERKNNFRLFPNPAIDEFTIMIPQESIKNRILQIRNLLGEIVFETSILSENQLIDVSTLKSGLYLVNYSDSFNKLIISR